MNKRTLQDKLHYEADKSRNEYYYNTRNSLYEKAFSLGKAEGLERAADLLEELTPNEDVLKEAIREHERTAPRFWK